MSFKTKFKKGWKQKRSVGFYLFTLLAAMAVVGFMAGGAMATVYLPTAADKTTFDAILTAEDDGATGDATVTAVNDNMTGDAASFRVCIRPTVGKNNTTRFNIVIYDTSDDGTNLTINSVQFKTYSGGSLIDQNTVPAANFLSLTPADWDSTAAQNDAVTAVVNFPNTLGSPAQFIMTIDYDDCAGINGTMTFPDASLTNFFTIDNTAPAVTKAGIAASPANTVYLMFSEDVFDSANNGTGEMIAGDTEATIAADHLVTNPSATGAILVAQIDESGVDPGPIAAAKYLTNYDVVSMTFLGNTIDEGDTLNWSGTTGIRDMARGNLVSGSATVELLAAPVVENVTQTDATTIEVAFNNTMAWPGGTWQLVDLDDNDAVIGGVFTPLTDAIVGGNVALTIPANINTDGTIWAVEVTPGVFTYSSNYTANATRHRVGVRLAAVNPIDVFGTSADIIGDVLEIDTDKADPQYSYVGTADTDLNGEIDAFVIYLTEPVTSAGLASADFLAQETESATPTDLTLGTVSVDDYKIVVPFTEAPALLTDGTAEVDLQIKFNDTAGSEAAFTLTDAAGNDSEVDQTATPTVEETGMGTVYVGVTDTTGPAIVSATVNEAGDTVAFTLSEASTVNAAYAAESVVVLIDSSDNKITFEDDGTGITNTSVTVKTFTINASSKVVEAGDKIYIYTYPTNDTTAVVDNAVGWPTVSTNPSPVILTLLEAAITPVFYRALATDSDGDGFFETITIYVNDDGTAAGNDVNIAMKGVDATAGTVADAVAADFADSFEVYDSAFNEYVGTTISITDNKIVLTLTNPSQVAGGLNVSYIPANNLNDAVIVNVAATDAQLIDSLATYELAQFLNQLTAAPNTANDIMVVDQDQNGSIDGVMMQFGTAAGTSDVQLNDTTDTTGISLWYWDDKGNADATDDEYVALTVSSVAVSNQIWDAANEYHVAYVTVSFDETTHKMNTDVLDELKIFYSGSQLVTTDGDQIGAFGQDGQTTAFTDAAAPAILTADLANNVLTLTMSENISAAVNGAAENYIVITDDNDNLISLEGLGVDIVSTAISATITVGGVTNLPDTVEAGQNVKFYNARNAIGPITDGVGTIVYEDENAVNINNTKTTVAVEIKAAVNILNAYGLTDAYGFYDRVIVSSSEALEIVTKVGDGELIEDAFQIRFNRNILENPTAVVVNSDGNLELTLATRLSIANDPADAAVIYTRPANIDDDDTAEDDAYIKGVSGDLLTTGTVGIVNGPNAITGEMNTFILNIEGTLSNFPVGTTIDAYLAKKVSTMVPVCFELTYNGITINGTSTGGGTNAAYVMAGGIFTNGAAAYYALNATDNMNSIADTYYYLHTDTDGNGLIGDYAVTNGPEMTSDNEFAGGRVYEEGTEADRTNRVSDDDYDTVVPLTIDWKTGKITGKNVKGAITMVDQTNLYVVNASGAVTIPSVTEGAAVSEGATSFAYSMPVYGSVKAAKDGGFCVLLVATYPDGGQDLLTSIEPADTASYVPFNAQYSMDSGTYSLDIDSDKIESVNVAAGWNLVPVPVAKIYRTTTKAKLATLPSALNKADAITVSDLRDVLVGLTAGGVPRLVGYDNILAIDNNGINYQIKIEDEFTGKLDSLVGGYGYMVDIPAGAGGDLYFFGTPISGSVELERNNTNFGWNIVTGADAISGFDYAIGFDPITGAVLQADPLSLDAGDAWLLHLDSGNDEETYNF